MARKAGVISRTLEIVRDLMSGAVHDRHSLANAFDLTVAAADRYIRELRRVPGVEVFRDGRSLRVKFNPSEAAPRPSQTTAVSACWASGVADVFAGSNYESGLRDALAFVTNRARRTREFQNVDRKFLFVARGGESSLPESAGVLDDLVDAVLRCRFVAIDYMHFDGRTDELRVQPLSMAIYDHQIYVIAIRPDGRPYPFRLSRVRDVDVLDDCFEYPSRAVYNPAELFRHSFGIFLSDDLPIRKVRVKLDARWRTHARTHRWHPSQRVDDHPDGVVLTLEVRDCWELRAWILGFGDEAVVVEPADLAARIAGLAAAMVRLYTPLTSRLPARSAKSKRSRRRREVQGT
jgi:predicted DNA-binding transcriptional regulator YafY